MKEESAFLNMMLMVIATLVMRMAMMLELNGECLCCQVPALLPNQVSALQHSQVSVPLLSLASALQCSQVSALQ